jgi:CHAT domain-containing protein/tetratricopeptide (TPR) repeat protein
MICRLFCAVTLFAAITTGAVSQVEKPSSTAAEKSDIETIVPGKTQTFSLKPGASKVFRYLATVLGETSLWARSETLDVTLEIQDKDGKRLKFDDDSGGWKSAHLLLPINKGLEVRVVVVAKADRRKEVDNPKTTTSFQLAVTEAEITKASEGLGEGLYSGAARMVELRKQGNLAAARKIGQGLVEKIAAESFVVCNHQLSTDIYNIGLQSYHAQDIKTASRCWSFVWVMRKNTLPAEHPDLTAICMDYGSTLQILGDLNGAKGLYEQVLKVREMTLPAEHPSLASIRLNYAGTLKTLGDLHGAKDLYEQVLKVREKTLPPEHPKLASIRKNYANTLRALGDLEGAKRLEEQVLKVLERTLPAEHLDLANIRMNYASTLYALRDYAGAKTLYEQVLKVYEKTLPAEHPDLTMIRMNYAGTLLSLGDLVQANDLYEQVLKVWEKTLPAEHPDLALIRMNFAGSAFALGEHTKAKILQEKALKVYEKILPADHPDLALIRMQYGITLTRLGDLAGAKSHSGQALRTYEKTLPAEHPRLSRSRMHYARLSFRIWSLDSKSKPKSEQLRHHLSKLLEGTILASMRSDLNLSSRQASLFSARWSESIDSGISYAAPQTAGLTNATSLFRISEEIRAKSILQRRLPALASQASGDLESLIGQSRLELSRCRESLSTFIANQKLPKASGPEVSVASHLGHLVQAKEEVEGRHRKLLLQIPGAESFLRSVTTEDIAKSLPVKSVGVSYWRYTRHTLDEPKNPSSEITRESYLAAFVLAPTGAVTLVDLGPIQELKSSIDNWRQLIGKSLNRGIEIKTKDGNGEVLTAGRKLRKLLIDPVLAAAGKDVNRIIVALADDLHLSPLDSLPLPEKGVVGDRTKIEIVNGLQWLVRKLPGELNPRRLLAMGDVDYLGKPRKLSENEIAARSKSRGGENAVGNPVWKRNFEELTFTEEEVRSIAKSFERAFDDEDTELEYIEPVVLRGRRADKQRLRAQAPMARYLHIATHGWFAPDSIPSITDRRPEDEKLGIMGSNFQDDVRGYEPLALCGLALAGASLEPNEDGSHPGLLAGTEIAQMDLSGVELAVLSACETNVGDSRAGQGIASLQEALFSAGVRYSITSLWEVPDQATKKLMASFYQGIWRRGMTKHDALWFAKTQLRNEKDSRTSKAIYGPKDWAGWVLVGNPE